ncbi:MAG: hypothetical protein EAZ20_08820 [Bacteroidetes bacterium]|nr:MAG: hypothetical protein EAZ20_08820 [Bacteroidota bacterium]
MFWTIFFIVLTAIITFGLTWAYYFIKNMKLISDHRQYRRKALELEEILMQKDGNIDLELKARERRIEILTKKLDNLEAEKLKRIENESIIKNEQFEVLQNQFENFKKETEKEKNDLLKQIELLNTK